MHAKLGVLYCPLFIHIFLGTHLFVEYHSVLMKHLIYFNTHLSMTDDSSASKFNYHFGVVIMEIINASIDCAPNDEEMFKVRTVLINEFQKSNIMN